ncbi:exported protein of unknown function [Nitrosotalea devaniterrae]|uniref:PEFG-CTERM sorting domain-containing protein n=1 Tax=Nitrosotalea devaniterrae TaxID=1078905 RepID=A0A128A3E0_9ARCH|nr:exported protein of unknown function [Candidatus Nitrosotalea devanaterra]
MMKVNVLTMNSKIHLVAIAFLTVSFLAVSAQTPITVSTDKTSYADGNTISISGTVADQLNVPISIVIRDSSHNMVYIAQTNPGSDGTYSTQAIAGGSTWKTAGTYEIDVTYGGADKTAKTTFEYTQGVSSQPSNTENQTNTTAPAIPEFGPLSVAVFAISFAVIIMYAKMRPTFKI